MSSWISYLSFGFIPAAPLAASLVILSFSRGTPQRARPRSGRWADRCADDVERGLVLRCSRVASAHFTIPLGSHSANKNVAHRFVPRPACGRHARDDLAGGALYLCVRRGYMADDKKFHAFFAYLSFFSGAMLGVVISNSCSCYSFLGTCRARVVLLIGFWIERPNARPLQQKRRSSLRASATWVFFSECSGSTIAAAHFSFTMPERVAFESAALGNARGKRHSSSHC